MYRHVTRTCQHVGACRGALPRGNRRGNCHGMTWLSTVCHDKRRGMPWHVPRSLAGLHSMSHDMPRRPMASRYAAENRNNVQIGVARILNLSRYVAAVINGYPTTMTCHGLRGHRRGRGTSPRIATVISGYPTTMTCHDLRGHCRGMPWHVSRRVVGSHGMSWDSPWHATACPGMS